MNVSLSSGQTVGGGRYILNKQLGDNALAWLAHDEIENKPVVLKFVPSELYQDPRGLEELRNQIAIAKGLSHPNIANVYDLYEAPGEEPFISLEYIEGMNLSSLQSMQPNRVYNWTFVAPLLKQIFAALQFVHENKIVQGAVKPSSLMLDRKGQVKLLDVGIAGILNNPLYGGPGATGAGGLLQYLSPQQVDAAPPQQTDDIYSLGITIYEFLTSTPPFYTGDILPQIRTTEPETIDQRLARLKVGNRVPPIVSSIVMSCLAKDPSARPQDVDTMARSLEFAELEPEPEPVKPAAAPPTRATAAPVAKPQPAPAAAAPVAPAPTPAKKKSPVALIAIVAAVLVIGAVVAFLAMRPDAADKPSDVATKPGPSAPSNDTATKPPATEPVDTEKETADEIKARRAAIEAAEIARLAARSDSGFVELFNGRDLDGWTGETGVWTVEDGAIVGQMGTDRRTITSLIWDGGQVSDFELRVQFRFDPEIGSKQGVTSITYRGRKVSPFEIRGYQCRMTKDGNNTGMLTARDRNGMIAYTQQTVVEMIEGGFDRSRKVIDLEPLPVILAAIKKNDWNEITIVAQGDQFVHKINGKTVADMKDTNERRLAKSGLLAIELMTDHRPYKAQFKSIRLKKLSK